MNRPDRPSGNPQLLSPNRLRLVHRRATAFEGLKNCVVDADSTGIAF